MDIDELGRRTADSANQILKGVSPGKLEIVTTIGRSAGIRLA